MAGKEKEEATAHAAASPAETEPEAPAQTSQTVDTAGKEKEQAGEDAAASPAETKSEAPAETSLTADMAGGGKQQVGVHVPAKKPPREAKPEAETDRSAETAGKEEGFCIVLPEQWRLCQHLESEGFSKTWLTFRFWPVLCPRMVIVHRDSRHLVSGGHRENNSQPSQATWGGAEHILITFLVT